MYIDSLFPPETKNERMITMNNEQLNAATEAMIGWLAHPSELGDIPVEIECTGEFELHELHYYIFKYKREVGGKWLLGVCGGYEEGELEHCGHVFSEMQEYHEETAVDDAVALVEYLRQYMMDLAKKAEERKGEAGTFVSYVLLEEAKWDKEAFLNDLKETWGIVDEPDDEDEDNEEDDVEADEEDSDDVIVINYQGAMIAVSIMPAPIPGDEAAYMVTNNFLWQDGFEQVKKHTAHLLIAVVGKDNPAVDNAVTLVKTVVCACKQEGVLGIYTGDTVLEPEYYLHFAGMLEEGLFPIYNLIWLGLHRSDKGLCGYTAGMRNFGYDEMEVLDSAHDPDDLLDFLASITNYVITEDVILQDGETIGFSADQRLPITKSPGVAVEGDSLKIEY